MSGGPNALPFRFLLKTARYEGDDCVIWPYARNSAGYGHLSTGQKRTKLAHRLICESVHGEAPEDRPWCAHSCGNGHLGCITPRHLRWASREENCRDSVAHGASSRGEHRPLAKLTEADVIEIRLDNRSHSELSRAFGVSVGVIREVRNRTAWSHVP